MLLQVWPLNLFLSSRRGLKIPVLVQIAQVLQRAPFPALQAWRPLAGLGGPRD